MVIEVAIENRPGPKIGHTTRSETNSVDIYEF